MLKKRCRRLISAKIYRSFYFWAIVLFCAYSSAGFLLVPQLLKSNISKQITLNLGWQTEIKQIHFNPYLFTLVIEGFTLKDKQQAVQVAFSHFNADFELRSVIEGAITFSNLSLIDPLINIQLNSQGLSNFQQALTSAAQQQPKQPTKNNTSVTLPGLLFDKVSVINGRFEIVNQQSKQTLNHNLSNINFELNDFSTLPNKQGGYQLSLALDSGMGATSENKQTLNWQGDISLSPFSSQGKLSLKGIQAEEFWGYFEENVPYKLQHADVDLDTLYKININNDALNFSLNNSFVNISNIKIAQKRKQKTFTTIDKILIGPFSFHSDKQQLMIQHIKIEALDLQLIRNKQGQLTLLNFPKTQKQQKTANSEPTSPFLWSIEQLELVNSQLQFSDHSLAKLSTIKVKDINLKLHNLSQDFSQDSLFEFSYLLDKSAKSNIEGSFSIDPFILNSKINIQRLHLPLIQPYLAQVAKIYLQQGKLSIQGALQLNKNKQHEIAGKFTGKVRIKAFSSRDKLLNKRLVGWRDLQLSPLTVNLNPLSINIKQIKLDSPYLRFIVDAKRNINLNQLLVSKQKKSKQQPDSQPLAINIDKISIHNGKTYFADLSLIPAFSSGIENLEGSIKGLSSNNLARANINIKGTIEEYGKVDIHGKINPLSGDLYTDLSINFDKIELTTLTPYSGRYAGYVIDKGKLSLQLNYKIAKHILEGSNRVILDQFELGDKVDSDEAVDLPLKLAIALFKDADGIIDINLPTRGDMDSPDFKVGGLVMKALGNLLLKAVSSPFSLLAGLVDGETDQLSQLAFRLGQSTLNDKQKENLTSIATLLKSRPQLMLEIRVNIDPQQESDALKNIQLKAQLQVDEQSKQDLITIMEALLSKRTSAQIMQDFRQQFNDQESAHQASKEQQNEDYQRALYQQLLRTEKIDGLALRELAQQRIRTIKEQLITVHGVPNQQVFALNPSLKGQANTGKIITEFTLSSH